MKEHFEIVQNPVKEIWWQIFSSINFKEPYFTLNKYFLTLLQEMVIQSLQERLESPSLNYYSRIRILPKLAKPTNQVLSLNNRDVDELLERITKLTGKLFDYIQENFLAALAPIASSAQSKKIIEFILTFIEKQNIKKFPQTLNNSIYFWEKNKKVGLYHVLCEHGKNLNYIDANQLAKPYFNTIKTPKNQTLQLLMLCAFGDKIEEKLREPISKEIIADLWNLVITIRGHKKMLSLCWLNDLNYFIKPNQAKEFIESIISNTSTHMEKIKNSYNPMVIGRVHGAKSEFYALGSLFKSLSSKLSQEELNYCIDLLDQLITVDAFDSNVELALEFLCSLNKIPSSTAKKIIDLSCRFLNQPDNYESEWAHKRENNFRNRMEKYFLKAVQNIDEIHTEKINLRLTDLLKLSSHNATVLCCVYLKIWLNNLKPASKETFLKGLKKLIEDMPEEEDENKKSILKYFFPKNSENQYEKKIPALELFSEFDTLRDFIDEPNYKESFQDQSSDQKGQAITSMLTYLGDNASDRTMAEPIFDLIGSCLPNILTEPCLTKLLQLLGHCKESDPQSSFELRFHAFQLVMMLVSINKVPSVSYNLFFSALEPQTNEQIMAAIYFKLHLRFTNFVGFFFCLDRDYQSQKNKEKTAFFFSFASPELLKIAAYAHQEVLAILKTIQSKEKRLDFLNQISSLSLFENYKLSDDDLVLMSNEEHENLSDCTIS